MIKLISNIIIQMHAQSTLIGKNIKEVPECNRLTNTGNQATSNKAADLISVPAMRNIENKLAYTSWKIRD